MKYCSKCGRELLNDDGILFCSVHVENMTPVTKNAEIVRKFKELPAKGG